MLREKWFKDTPEEAMRISMDSLLPAFSDSGVFTKEGLLKVKHIYETAGEKIDLNFQRRWLLDQCICPAMTCIMVGNSRVQDERKTGKDA